jgi:glycosyltransferase involved in cell wall biosynthesis
MRLVAMGRLGPEKGFDLLIAAFARLAATHPEWSLTILGEGRERARLEALVESLGMTGRVSLPGRAADPLPHLAIAHVFALSSRREGFPNALLEAMAAGLPPVAFDCRSGPAEIITDGVNGLLVPDGDVDALAASLRRLMESPAERQRLGANARGVADVLSPDRILLAWDALVGARRRS